MRKSLNFDLDTKKLKEYYPNKNYTEAYNDIKKFLTDNGFEHRQGSGYISKNNMSNQEAVNLVIELNKNHTWLETCCKTFYYSNIGQEYDALLSIKKDKNKTLEANKPKGKEVKPIENEPKRSEKLISNYEPKSIDKTKNKDIER